MPAIELDQAKGHRPPEPVLVYEWRHRQFALLGFDSTQAFLLAGSVADLGLTRRLVGAGCPPATAFAIVY